jgi:hypothetical protein
MVTHIPFLVVLEACHGGPLSPLLFVIIMDPLSRVLSRAMVGGFLSGFWVDILNATLMEISHLLFVDDTLIMCDVVIDQIHYLGLILLVFWVISVEVNLRKSKLVAVGEVLHKEELVGILSVSISSLPMEYLGLHLGAPFNQKPFGTG